MEQQKNTRPSDPKTANTEIHTLLNELIQKDLPSLPEKNTTVKKTSAEKTPLANLKTILSKADAIAKEGKGTTQSIQAPLPKEDNFFSFVEKKFSPSAEPFESDAIIRLHKLIEAHRSKKTT